MHYEYQKYTEMLSFLRLSLFIFNIFFFFATFSQTANSLFEAGEKKFHEKDYTAAIAEFTKCVEKNEFFYEAYTGRGNCYVMQKNFDAALKDFNKAIEIFPKYYQAYTLRGKVYAELKDFKKAIADYGKTIELKPEYEEAYLARAELYSRSNDLKQAFSDLTKAILINSENQETYLKRAAVSEKLKKEKDALADYTAAIKIKATLAEAYYRRGLIYEKESKYSLAASDFLKATELKMSNKDIHSHCATVCFLSGNYEKAAEHITMLLTIFNLKDAKLYYKRAICYYHTDKLEEALKDFTKSSQLDPKNDSAHLYMAKLYISRHNSKSAQLCYTKAINANAGNAEAYAGRASLWFTQNKYEAALNDYNNALRIIPCAEWYFFRSECKEALNDLKGMCDDIKSSAALGYPKATKVLEAKCQ